MGEFRNFYTPGMQRNIKGQSTKVGIECSARISQKAPPSQPRCFESRSNSRRSAV